jgi:hypothetical protein
MEMCRFAIKLFFLAPCENVFDPQENGTTTGEMEQGENFVERGAISGKPQ